MDEVPIAAQLRHQAYAQKELLIGENDFRLRFVPSEPASWREARVHSVTIDTELRFDIFAGAAEWRREHTLTAATDAPEVVNTRESVIRTCSKRRAVVVRLTRHSVWFH